MRLTFVAVSVFPHFRRLHTGYWRLGSSKRLVGTWSPLGTAFNTRAETLSQPRNQKSESVGLFKIPELHDHSGFSVLLVFILSVFSFEYIVIVFVISVLNSWSA